MALQARGKTWVIDLGLNCPFKQWPINVVPTFLACSAEVSHLVLKWLKAARIFYAISICFFFFFFVFFFYPLQGFTHNKTAGWIDSELISTFSVNGKILKGLPPLTSPHLNRQTHITAYNWWGFCFEKRLVICSKVSSLDLFLSLELRRSPEQGL